MRAGPRGVAVLAFVVLASVLSGCAGWPLARGPREAPLRLSELDDAGDPARRASLRLVIDGLDADEDGLPERALGSYERAIQVDPTNPWAYIAIARHHADGLEPDQALPFLDQASALLRAQGESSPRAEAALDGIRGQALVAMGRYDEGHAWLERAYEASPDVWSDGHLSATELR